MDPTIDKLVALVCAIALVAISIAMWAIKGRLENIERDHEFVIGLRGRLDEILDAVARVPPAEWIAAVDDLRFGFLKLRTQHETCAVCGGQHHRGERDETITLR